MSTNPNNAVGTNAAYDGRTSVKAFNDSIGAYSRGIISGWACLPNSGMTVSLGGDGTTRDIAIAEDVSGNKITVNNISESPISVTMSAAPSSNSRIDLIVAYVDNPPQGSATVLDNPAACGLITVNGTAAANPVAPNESAIRTAITADGASGSTAYYVILAQITIASGTTDIVAGNISAGDTAAISGTNISLSSSFSYTETSSIVTISNVENYNYKKITGTEVIVNVKAGEKYLLIGNACIMPSAAQEVYLMVRANGASIGPSVLNGNVLQGSYTNLTKVDFYTATTNASVTFSLYTGLGNGTNLSVNVLNGATLLVLKVS